MTFANKCSHIKLITLFNHHHSPFQDEFPQPPHAQLPQVQQQFAGKGRGQGEGVGGV